MTELVSNEIVQDWKLVEEVPKNYGSSENEEISSEPNHVFIRGVH